jgi:hypothetical protein
MSDSEVTNIQLKKSVVRALKGIKKYPGRPVMKS